MLEDTKIKFPGKYSISVVGGALQKVGAVSSATAVNNEGRECGGFPWTFTPVADELASPTISAKYTNNAETEFCVYTTLTVNSSTKIEDLEVIAFTGTDHPGNVYIVVCFSGDTTNPTKVKKLNVSFTVTLDKAISELEACLYLHKDDPMTSRGTKTSVQSSKLDHGDKKISTIEMS